MNRLLFLSPSHREQHYHKLVLRIRLRDPVPFGPWIRDPVWVKNQDQDPG